MTTTHAPMADRNVAFFTISRKEAARLIRDLADALATSEQIQMELRTDIRMDYSKREYIHEIRLGLQNSFNNTTGRITESASWE